MFVGIFIPEKQKVLRLVTQDNKEAHKKARQISWRAFRISDVPIAAGVPYPCSAYQFPPDGAAGGVGSLIPNLATTNSVNLSSSLV